MNSNHLFFILFFVSASKSEDISDSYVSCYETVDYKQQFFNALSVSLLMNDTLAEFKLIYL